MAPKSFSHALSILKSYDKFGSKPGLSRIRKLCRALGNPQNDFKSIIVAGTNGKGSTTAMIASILRASGHKTGAYYSPHIFDICERIAINGKKISHEDFGACVCEADRIARKTFSPSSPPTFFEILTAAAFLHFSRARVDFAVLEVGMGGRLDATNICDAELSCITSIGLDHTKYLGRTTSRIAFEKTGVAKKGKFLAVGNVDDGALRTIKSICRKKKSILIRPSNSDFLLARRAKLPLGGAFQIENAALASCACRHLRVAAAKISRSLSPAVISLGLSSATLPARMQKISLHPLVLFDSAHNPPAAAAISRSLPKLRGSHSPSILLFTSMSDKDYISTLSFLAPHFDAAVVYSLPFARSEKSATLSHAAEISGEWKIYSAKSPRKAFSFARRLAGKNGFVLACGSMYAFQFLTGNPSFPVSQ